MANRFKYNNDYVSSGDLVRVHQRIVEGEKERIQIFEGLVISIKGSGDNLMFTVRKIATGGIGVERIFPANSPWVSNIEIKKKGTVRRAKLYYIREKTRKQNREITNASAQ
jgi:large subunit ribosomal protein L19